MPDISMCQDAECPMKESCYRYTAKPKELHQSWFTGNPIHAEDCEFFVSNKPYNKSKNTTRSTNG